MKIYIAGPMRSLPGWNWPAFASARRVWQLAGHQVFCPAACATALGYGPDDEHHAEPDSPDGKAHLTHVLHSDIGCLMHADAIALLPGWQRSRGATMELAVAQFLGLPVFDAVTLKLMHPQPPMTPWHEVSRLEDASAKTFVPMDDDWYSVNPVV